jgi:ABC-2 type transport system permease protein
MEMRGSFRAETLKIRKRPAMWIVAGVYLVLSQVFGYLIPYVSYLSDGEGGPGFAGAVPPEQILAYILPAGLVSNLLGGFPLFGGAIALIIGALVAGSEYGWGTLKTALTQRPRRLSVYGGKLVTVGIAMLTLVLATFAVGAVWSGVIASVESESANWPSAADLARGVASGWLILATWSLVGVMLGVLFRGTSLAIGLGLVWVLVIENLMRGVAPLLGFVESVEKWLPGVNAGSLVAALGAATVGEAGGTPGVTAAVSGPQAALVLMAYVVALAVAAGFVLQRQDVT